MKAIKDIFTRTGMYLDALYPAPPVFYTPNSITFENDVLFLRAFQGGSGNPMFVTPPQAGHHSSIADHGQGQSLIQTIMQACPDRPVFCIEWKTGSLRLPSTSISYLLRQTEDAMAFVRHQYPARPMTLVGLCQGGWFDSLLTIRNPTWVEGLFVAGAPIDAHIGGGAIQELVQKIPQKTYEDMVKKGGGLMSGDMMLLGWKMMHMWDRFGTDFQALWNATADDETYEKAVNFRAWYEFTQDLGGDWYLWAIDSIFRKNELAKGCLKIAGEVHHLSSIKCPVVSIVGTADDVTLVEQCEAIHFLTANNPEQRHFLFQIEKCGHVGVFMGTKSQAVWGRALVIYDNVVSGKAPCMQR